MRLGIRIYPASMEKAKDLSMLTRKEIINKRGHKQTVYVKLGLPMKKEPWDSSTEKAKTLKISDFGTPEEVRGMAKMPRTAKSREDAVTILKRIATNGNLTSKSGVVASLSMKSIGKIVSNRTLHQSFNTDAHWQAAANVDKLFSNAIEPWKFEMDSQKNNEHLKDRRYLFAPMEYSGRIVPIKFTVKEYKQEGADKRIYSIEAVNVDL